MGDPRYTDMYIDSSGVFTFLAGVHKYMKFAFSFWWVGEGVLIDGIMCMVVLF